MKASDAVQWAREALSVEPSMLSPVTLSAERLYSLVTEIDRLRAERNKLFDLVSSFKTPLFQLRMQTITMQGKIDEQISDLRRAWFEEHEYPGEGERT